MPALIHLARKAVRKIGYALQFGYWPTGERVCPDFPEDNFINHLKVYRFAVQFASGKRVLDIGCGTGYGIALLSEFAKSATGIDISWQALRYARRRYPQPRYLLMNAERLEFPDNSFDFIISTENFEHLKDQKRNLREMARILAPNGMLLLATPNPERFTDQPRNRFHTHECTYEELRAMLEEVFKEVEILETIVDPKPNRGIIPKEDLHIFRQLVNTTYLSNTHSFMCFCRSTRLSAQP